MAFLNQGPILTKGKKSKYDQPADHPNMICQSMQMQWNSEGYYVSSQTSDEKNGCSFKKWNIVTQGNQNWEEKGLCIPKILCFQLKRW